jgi:subtilisin
MEMNQPKRYLVTYAEGNVTAEKATSLLGIARKKIKDGTEFMATEVTPAKEDVLHFESLGISNLELSTEDASRISQQEGIMAVEEDFEMFALENESDEQQYNDLFMSSDESFDLTENAEDLTFDDGYDKALLDVFASVLKNNRKKSGTEAKTEISSLSGGFPVLPRPDILPLRLQPIPWNIIMIKAPQAWARGIYGTGIKVAILDTGIANHPDLSVSGGVCFVPGSTSYNDLHSHGTHCAGIVAARNNLFGVVGVAPRAILYAVKVLSDSGSGMSSWIIAGLDWCTRNGIKVASMSLGGTNPPSVAYATAIKRCQDRGVTVVVASGNSYDTSFPWVCSPANSIMPGFPNASPIAVGSVDNRCMIAGSSSRGGQTNIWNQVTCVAPGVRVNSTVPGGGYGLKSGTSMACPHVAGLAALINQRYPGISPINVKRRIATTCTDCGPRGLDATYGYGLINCDLATR